MKSSRGPLLLAVLLSVVIVPASISAKDKATIQPGSKIYIAPMGGFEEDLKAAFEAKKVPLVLVDRKEDAAYEMTGTSESKKAGTAKILITGSWHSKEEASVQVADLKSGIVAFAYSYSTENSTHGKKSSAEACAKHLKDAIESK